MSTWSLPAASGRIALRGSFLKRLLTDREEVSPFSEMYIEALSWPRDSTAEQSSLERDFEVHIALIPLSASSISTLIEALERWLKTPCRVAAEIADAESTDQRLQIVIDVSTMLLSSVENPCVLFLTVDRHLLWDSGPFSLMRPA